VHGKQATVTAVQPPGRFGALDMDGTSVKSFVEKPHGDGMYINGGFFVLSPKVMNLIEDDRTIWERFDAICSSEGASAVSVAISDPLPDPCVAYC
jgi:NDP-sugar pyrophosphorylase family protein